MATLLINVSDFSERVDISSHVADKYIDRHILTAQDRYVKPILGAEFYAQLIDEKETGYWTGSNETLVQDYLTPYLVWRSYQTYLPHSGIFQTGMGARVMTEDNSTPISNDQLKLLTSQARDQAQYYERELTKYLSDNLDSFELYEDAEDKITRRYLPKLTSAGVKSRSERGRRIYSKEED